MGPPNTNAHSPCENGLPPGSQATDGCSDFRKVHPKYDLISSNIAIWYPEVSKELSRLQTREVVDAVCRGSTYRTL